MKTADKMEKDYLKNPNCCPFCGSTNINADHGEFDDNQGFRNVDCDNCNKNWVEEFALAGVTFNIADVT